MYNFMCIGVAISTRTTGPILVLHSSRHHCIIKQIGTVGVALISCITLFTNEVTTTIRLLARLDLLCHVHLSDVNVNVRSSSIAVRP